MWVGFINSVEGHKSTVEISWKRKQIKTQTTVWWSPEAKRGVGVVKGKRGQMYGERRRFDLG